MIISLFAVHGFKIVVAITVILMFFETVISYCLSDLAKIGKDHHVAFFV